MVEVTLWGGLVPLADNQKTLTVEARTIREVLRTLQERYPALSGPIKNEVAVVVDGVVYRNDWSQEIPEGAEVFLMRRLAGG
ncbi:MAG: MoaD/ThiS family protein [Roseobacter sp.]